MGSGEWGSNDSIFNKEPFSSSKVINEVKNARDRETDCVKILRLK